MTDIRLETTMTNNDLNNIIIPPHDQPMKLCDILKNEIFEVIDCPNDIALKLISGEISSEIKFDVDEVYVAVDFVQPEIGKVITVDENYWECPFCLEDNYFDDLNGKVECPKCGAEFKTDNTTTPVIYV